MRDDHWRSAQGALALRRPSTRRAYASTLKKYASFLAGDVPNGSNARAFLSSLAEGGLTGASLERHKAALRWFFEEAWNIALKRLPKVTKDPPKVRWLTEDEIQNVIAACESPKELAVVYVLYGNGLRANELLDLTVENITDDAIHVRRKGGTLQWLPAFPETIDALKAYVGDRRTGPTFDFGYDTLRRLIAGLANRAGVAHFTPKALRHSAATHMQRRGMSIEDIQVLLGHRRLDSTLVYIHGRDLDKFRDRMVNLLPTDHTSMRAKHVGAFN